MRGRESALSFRNSNLLVDNFSLGQANERKIEQRWYATHDMIVVWDTGNL